MDMDLAKSRSTSEAVRTAAAWRTAGERGDVAAAGRCLAAGIKVVSPLTAQFRFCGQQQCLGRQGNGSAVADTLAVQSAAPFTTG